MEMALITVLRFISDTAKIRSYRIKEGLDSPAIDNKAEDNATHQLRSHGKSVIKLGIRLSCSNFQC